nr:MAG TPA: hypothetical protein [Caudoviricetes sp.]
MQWVFGREVLNRDVSNDYDLVTNHNISRAQIIGVGEIPLNRKGLLSAHNGGDEEIV